MLFKKLPKFFQFLLASVLVTLTFLAIMRIVFWLVFNDPGDTISSGVTMESFYIGFKFDLRLALLIHLPLLLLAWLKPVFIPLQHVLRAGPPVKTKGAIAMAPLLIRREIENMLDFPFHYTPPGEQSTRRQQAASTCLSETSLARRSPTSRAS